MRDLHMFNGFSCFFWNRNCRKFAERVGLLASVFGEFESDISLNE